MQTDARAGTSKEFMSDEEKERRRRSTSRSSCASRRSSCGTTGARSAIGMSLMLVSRVAGLVLPGTTKFLIDDVIGKRRADLLVPVALAAAGATLLQAATSFALSQVVSVAGAARDHRHAQARPGARDPPADPLLRLDQVRRADLADHERRRGHPEPGRHRDRAARAAASSPRVLALGVLLLPELAAHGGDARRCSRSSADS